jgi:hypothetical protein
MQILKATKSVIFPYDLANQRRLRVERCYYKDAFGETHELSHITNGIIGLLLETGHGSNWAAMTNQATIHGVPVMGCGSDYAFSDGTRSDGPFYNTIHGPDCWTMLSQLDFQNSADAYIDPEGLSPDDTKVKITITRMVGAGSSTTAKTPVMTLTENKTAAVYLTDAITAGATIYRNDTQIDGNITEGIDLRTASTGNGTRGMVGKIIEYDPVEHGYPAAYVRIWFYISAITDDKAMTLWMNYFPCYRATSYSTVYKGWAAKGGTTSHTKQGLNSGGAAWAVGWNYVDVLATFLRPGTNLIQFDGAEMTQAKKMSIGVDTAVVSSARNKAYLLSILNSNCILGISHTYTLYRDSDKIEMQPGVATGNPINNGAPMQGRANYNFSMIAPGNYPYVPRESYPFGEHPFRRYGYKHVTPNRLDWFDSSGVPITIAPGSATTPWGNNKDLWKTAGQTTYLSLGVNAYSPYAVGGAYFYPSSAASKGFRVTFESNGYAATKPQLTISKFSDAPFWYSSADPPVPNDETVFNDVVFYLSAAQLYTDTLPKAILDLSGLVPHF